VGRNIPTYENWAEHAAGNQFIFNSIVECNRKHQFKKGDLIGIMWTSCLREDRYVDDRWVFAATEQREKVYGAEWMKKFGAFEAGNLVRDLASIDAMQHMLDNLKVDWFNLNSIPLIRFDYSKVYDDIDKRKITITEVESRWISTQVDLSKGTFVGEEYLLRSDIIHLYKDIFTKIKLPLLEKIIKKDRYDRHPTLEEAGSYLTEMLNVKDTTLLNFDNRIIPDRI
jgi:hypothetical protein